MNASASVSSGRRVVVTIGPGGTVRYIDARGAQVVGSGRRDERRVSRVEPACLPLRLVFGLLRAICRDDSRVAAWTRTWNCRWRARIYGGPTQDGFASRAAAIAWEIAWVQEHGL